MKKRMKLGVADACASLRKQGYKPHYVKGTLIDWRRVEDHKLQSAEVTAHPSGRVTIVKHTLKGADDQ